jgi:hypothetical protein
VSGQAIWHSLDLARLLGPGGLGNPGYLAMAVGAVGLWAAFRRGGEERETALFWGIAVVVFYLLALGPTLQFDGRDTGLPMPYGVMQDLPVISSGRNPGRFSLVALLGLAILVAFGLREIFRVVAKRMSASGVMNRGAIAALVGVVFVGVTLAGFVNAAGGVTIDRPDWPPFYQQIANDRDDYAILELPMFTDLGLGEQHYQVFQVMHNKPRFSGRWARDHKLTNPDNFVKHASLFRHLLYTGYDKEQYDEAFPDHDFLRRTDLEEQGARILAYYKVRYVVLYKDALGPALMPSYVTAMRNILGEETTPFYEDGMMTVYRVGSAAVTDGDPLTLDVGDGWFKAETNPAGKVYRWADSRDGQQSELYTINLTQGEVKAELKFTAYTWKIERNLSVKLNGVEAANIVLKPEEGEKEYSVEMSLPPGNTIITFGSAEPQQPTGQPGDSRELSFGMYGVDLQAKP